MCLAVPMRIIKISGDFADVELSRLRKRVNIQLVPDLKIGDYCIVHAGFAIQKINQVEANKTLKILKEL